MGAFFLILFKPLPSLCLGGRGFTPMSIERFISLSFLRLSPYPAEYYSLSLSLDEISIYSRSLCLNQISIYPLSLFVCNVREPISSSLESFLLSQQNIYQSLSLKCISHTASLNQISIYPLSLSLVVCNVNLVKLGIVPLPLSLYIYIYITQPLSIKSLSLSLS